MVTAPITVVMPTIGGLDEPRGSMYNRACQSVVDQTLRPGGGISVVLDRDHEGAATTRNRALAVVTTPWVAFLDDDDEFMADHLRVLWDFAQMWGHDVVYPGCEIVTSDGQRMPHEKHMDEWGRFGKPFSPEILAQRSCIPVTCLARTDLAQAARFGAPEGSIYDDWGFYQRIYALGAKIEHIPVRTWIWHHHGANTSGQPDRW
jgi:hypothetical protein